MPDAIIHASIRLLIETKIHQNAISTPDHLVQIKAHLTKLHSGREATKRLLVITPDDVRPTILDSLTSKKDKRALVWSSFARLDQAIDEMLGEDTEVTSERESFLLRQLQMMLEDEYLLASSNDVVVVSARDAWPEYNQIHAYVCQPKRQFQQVSRVAFYTKGQIYPLVPKILEKHDDVLLVRGQHPGKLGQLVDRLIKEKRREEGGRNKVLLLSAPDSPDTLHLPGPIMNNSMSQTGKPIAFTMGQRYVYSERLKTAKTTQDLVSKS